MIAATTCGKKRWQNKSCDKADSADDHGSGQAER
jgi:hypothetical protein